MTLINKTVNLYNDNRLIIAEFSPSKAQPKTNYSGKFENIRCVGGRHNAQKARIDNIIGNVDNSELWLGQPKIPTILYTHYTELHIT